MTKKMNLLVSFSGGETSAFMAQWIKKHLEDKYENIIYVFANTGLENEQTLEFVQQCDDFWKLNVKWVEARIDPNKNKGNSYWLTDFENAMRKGEPFESVIAKYGIPNIKAPHCTRELKQNPISKFAGDYFESSDYYTAIGIRADEFDRVNPQYKSKKLIYPLINMIPTPANKQMINFFWKQMPFRLNLKGYQGNCLTCWKKSDKKLFQIHKENPKAFEFMDKMERKYPRVGAEFEKFADAKNRVFFRKNRSATQIMCEAENFNGSVQNDSDDYNFQTDLLGGENCEVFSECSN